jgi:DNA-damage-inducible protein D
MENESIIPFNESKIRKIWQEGEWFFSVVDVIAVLTDSVNPRNYWTVLKKRENQLMTVCHQLKMPSADKKNYKTDCANTEGVLRILMSIPSPKAEPFKLWLASVGNQVLEDAENPELELENLKEIYRAKGYDDIWIGNRLKSIGIRKELTDEWKKRGIKEHKDYSILTAEIAKWTFGLTPSEHRDLKGLNKQNLRDHMTTLELLFSAIGEEATRIYTIQEDANGFHENYETAQSGGRAAGRALKALEADKKIKVVSSDNFLNLQSAKNDTALPPDDAGNRPPTPPEA